MAGDAALGRAVLELSTDSKDLDAGLADVPKKVKKTGDAAKEAAGPLGQLNGLLATFGVSLSVGAVVGFAKSILDLADNITKVHDKTGLTTDEVQRLQYIAEQSGNSIDDLAGSISKLQVRLADGAAQKGIENLGLNFKQIRESSPYDALAQVAEAIGKIENPTLRAQRAVEVFGKAGTEILPTLTANFKELGAAAPVMSADTVAALDAAGDAIAKFGSTLKVWAAESYNYARGFFDKMIAEAYRMVQKLYESAAGLAALAAKLPGAQRIGVNQKLVDSLKESAVWYGNVATAMDTNTVAAKKNAPAVGALPPIHKEASKEAKAHAEAIAKLTEQLSGAGAIKAARDMVEALGKLPPIQRITKDGQIQIAQTMEAAAAVYRAAGKSIPRDLQLIALAARAASHTVSESTKVEIEEMQKAWAKTSGIKLSALPIAIGFEDTTWATRETLKATRSFVGIVSQVDTVAVGKAAAARMKGAIGPNFWKSTFGTPQEFGANMGNAIMGAIQGGGSILNAVGGTIGQQLGTSISKKLGDSLMKEGAGAMSKALGGLLQAVLPAVGALLGPLLEKVWGGIKKLFGANAGHDLAKQFASTFSGGFDEIQQKLQAIGREDLWKRLTQSKDPKAVQAAIDDVTKAFARQEDQLKELTAAQNTQLSGLIDTAGVWKKLPADMVPYLDKLVEAGLLTEANAAKLRAMGDFGADDFDRLKSKADQFGVSLDALGPAFQQAALDKDAKDIIGFFDEMLARGGDYNGLLVGMQEEISGVVQQSIKFGTEIPANMKPWIDDLAKSGRLLDESGEKITDTSKLKYGEEIKVGLEDVVAKLQEMIDLMKTDLPAAAGEAADRVNAKLGGIHGRKVTIDYEEGDLPPGTEPVPMAGGGMGRITRPTLFYSGGNEDFAFSGEGRSFGLGAMAERPIVIENVTTLDGAIVARNQVRHTPNALSRVGVRSI